jgi:hypothetical protein
VVEVGRQGSRRRLGEGERPRGKGASKQQHLGECQGFLNEPVLRGS